MSNQTSSTDTCDEKALSTQIIDSTFKEIEKHVDILKVLNNKKADNYANEDYKNFEIFLKFYFELEKFKQNAILLASHNQAQNTLKTLKDALLEKAGNNNPEIKAFIELVFNENETSGGGSKKKRKYKGGIKFSLDWLFIFLAAMSKTAIAMKVFDNSPAAHMCFPNGTLTDGNISTTIPKNSYSNSTTPIDSTGPSSNTTSPAEKLELLQKTESTGSQPFFYYLLLAAAGVVGLERYAPPDKTPSRISKFLKESFNKIALKPIFNHLIKRNAYRPSRQCNSARIRGGKKKRRSTKRVYDSST